MNERVTMVDGVNIAAARNQQRAEMLKAQEKGLRANLIGIGQEARLKAHREQVRQASLVRTATLAAEITDEHPDGVIQDIDSLQIEANEEREA